MCEQVDVAAAQGIEARMIGNQPDVLAAERRKPFCFQNVEPRLHPNGVAGAFAFGGRPRGESGRCKQSNEQSEWSECSERAFRGGQNGPPQSGEYNDILEHADRGCVESTRCVCYE